jgi:uncharacterized BrkB/YihY/UPF0761 family membrane protein
MDFLKNLFFGGLTASDTDFLTAYFSNTLWMLVLCLIFAYLTLIVLLLLGAYTKPEKVHALADAETRIMLCGTWGTYAAMVLLVGAAIWIYGRAVLPPQTDPLRYTRPLASHATVLGLLLVLWLFLYFEIRKESKIAQSYRP